MKIFQILHGFCHWLTPFTSLEETKNYPPDCIFVEAPDYVNEQWGYDETKEGDERFIRPEAPEGWAWDEETGTFYNLADVPIQLEAAKDSKQAENKMKLATFLSEHPLTWTDGKQYGVTYEDQSEINLNIAQYQVQVEAAKTDPSITPVLEWHALKEACVPWTYENLCALVLAISDYVYPWFVKMNEYKAQIYACEDKKEVQAIELDYHTEEEIAAEEAEEAEEAARIAAEEAANTSEEVEEAVEEATEEATETTEE